MGRYTGSPDTLVFDQRIDLRGFSAGSFAGLSTLHLLWKIPNVVTNGKLGAIACPPQLIVTPPTDHTLHLLHYEADQLCVWKPGGHQLDQLQIRYTYVSTEGPAYKEHFGSKEHNYSHWLSLNHTAGWWDLARFLFMNPEAASSAKRDATPLRLLSWLSFRLEPVVEKLIEATMLYLSTVDEVKDSELLELGRMHLEVDTPFASAEVLRDHLIELISVRNLRHRPEALFALFRQFLQRLTLPRMCHFLDLVLPQLTPVRAPWADATRTLWTCHHIRAITHENGHPYEPTTESRADPMRTQFSRLSSSHTSLLRLVERKLKTGFGNELSPQRLSLPCSPLTLHGPSVVMLYAGEAIANIWLSTRHTWDCMDAPSRRTFSLSIWSS